MDEKTRLLYFLTALGALSFALTATLNTGVSRLVFTILAVLCTAKAIALKRNGTDPTQPPGASSNVVPVTQGNLAPTTTRDRVFRGIGRAVLWVVLAPLILLVVFTVGWAGLCMIRGSCG